MTTMNQRLDQQKAIAIRRIISAELGCGYEWLDGELWYRGEPVQGRMNESEERVTKLIQQNIALTVNPLLYAPVVKTHNDLATEGFTFDGEAAF